MRCKRIEIILCLCMFFGIISYFINRGIHSRNELINEKYGTAYKKIIWNYGKPDIITEIGSGEPLLSVFYFIDEDTSYWITFDHEHRLAYFDVVDNGVVFSRD
ncbi:hypothetical protein [Treponema sp.]|uniref:hypothetical protein n=1 Tax=Treponema sp. TaxID=166 RepID=UPI00388DFECA